jgi:hypothetical protein
MRRALLVLLPLALAACGGGARSGRTVTFQTAGTFPPITITGTYTAAGCASDGREIARQAHLYYLHSTTAPGPADLYFYDMRFAYAHFQADDCTSAELGRALERGLTARERTFLLANSSSDLAGPFRAALQAVR